MERIARPPGKTDQRPGSNCKDHHNAPFLRRVLADEAFALAELDTRLLEHRPHYLKLMPASLHCWPWPPADWRHCQPLPVITPGNHCRAGARRGSVRVTACQVDQHP